MYRIEYDVPHFPSLSFVQDPVSARAQDQARHTTPHTISCRAATPPLTPFYLYSIRWAGGGSFLTTRLRLLANNTTTHLHGQRLVSPWEIDLSTRPTSCANGDQGVFPIAILLYCLVLELLDTLFPPKVTTILIHPERYFRSGSRPRLVIQLLGYTSSCHDI